MAEEQLPFADVRPIAGGFSIPELKWRELVFVGALCCQDGVWVRDASRPLPSFCEPNPFPPGVRLERIGTEQGRVLLRRLA